MLDRPRVTVPETLPGTLAVFPLPGALLLPGGQLPLNIFEPRYLNMVEDALAPPRLIGMIQPVAEKDERRIGDVDRLYGVGCAGRIVHFEETGDGRYAIRLQGVARFRVVEELPMTDGYRRVRPDFSEFAGDFAHDDGDTLAERDDLVRMIEAYFRQQGLSADMEQIEKAPDDVLVTSLAMSCPFEPGEKQALLECAGVRERGQLLARMFEMALLGGGMAPPSDLRQ